MAIQDPRKKAESADRSKEKILELYKQVMDLKEKVALAESRPALLERELEVKFDLDVAQIERDTHRSAHAKQIKTLKSLIAELKDKEDSVEERMDTEYNSRLAFSYNCIMSILRKEYLELNMDKLKASVTKYIAEQV